MNEQSKEQFEAEQIRVNTLPNKKRVVRSSMFGIPEFIAIGLGLLSLLLVGLFYFFFVSPANAELKLHKDISQKLSTENDDAKKKFGNISTTKERVSELLNSVDYFERNYLPIASLGKTGLYQRINALISAYGLINTTGPDFTPLEISTIKQSQQNEKEKGRGKFQSLFPGVYVSVTVEGTYQNLRRFIREIESSGQFVIVSTVELEAAEGENKIAKQPASKVTAQRTPYPRPNNPTEGDFPIDSPNLANPNLAPQQTNSNPKFVPLKGKTRGDVVSLHLEMAAYFRRNIQSEQQILAADKATNE
jgi:Tfp pilus assembly protein PilO